MPSSFRQDRYYEKVDMRHCSTFALPKRFADELKYPESVGGTGLGAVISNLGTLAPGTPATPIFNVFIVGCASTVCNVNGAAAASASNPVTPSNQPVGSAAFATTQPTACGTTSTSVIAARTGISGTGRISATITNTTTAPIFIGNSGVTTSTGTLLPGIVGASLTINTTAAISCVVASGTAGVTAIENF
jgi:hypothetical protein